MYAPDYISRICESFSDKDVVLSDKDNAFKNRIIMVLDIMLSNLYLTDRKIFKEVQTRSKDLNIKSVTFYQVLNDILVARRIVANDRNPTGDPNKIWQRYFIEQTNLEAIAIARQKNDAYTMSYASNTIGKHNLTDKEDVEKIPYDEIIPFNPIPTTDPSVLGITVPDNIDKIREHYRRKFSIAQQNYIHSLSVVEAETVEYEETNK